MNGIPMAEIERIEVLPTTASGIYGGSATGGVINIVLRRDYEGIETKLTYDNSFAGDAPSGRIDFSSGSNFEEGKTNVLFSGSISRSGLLEVQDRDFYQRGIDSILANNPSLILGSSSPPLGSTPNIRSSNGSNLTLKNCTSLNSPITFVPVGYAGIASDNGAGLIANAGRYNLNLANSGQLGGGAQSDILGASRAKSLMGTVRRQFTPWFQAYLDGAWSENPERHYNAPSGSFSVAANSPNNPFNQAVVVRVPTTELSGATGFLNRNTRLAAGAIVKFPKDWLAAGDVTWNSTSLRSNVAPTINASAVSTISSGAAGTPNLFHDPAVAPFNLQTLPLVNSFPAPFNSSFVDESLRVSGPTLRLPGGPITFSALLEHRVEDLDSSYTVSSLGVTSLFPHRSQSVVSGYAELFVPLVSQLNRVPLVEELGLQLAGRHDDYTINGTNSAVAANGAVVSATDRTRSTNPTVAVRYEPIRGVALRASYGTGFVAPNVTQLVSNTMPLNSLQTDPRRGNQSVTVPVLFGGNPDLRPE
ncbi:MAG TPA: TonB-dependent receptor, partial [Steroidobacteraceae bacterium]